MIQDLECERMVIGTILSIETTISNARAYLTADCFTNPRYREIYKAALEVDDKGGVVNIVTCNEVLSRKDSYVGIQDIIDASITTYIHDITPYALRLRDLQSRREMNTLGLKLIEASEKELEPVAELLSKSRDMIEKASSYTSTKNIGTLKDATNELFEHIANNQSGKNQGTMTGFQKFDEKGGFHGGDLIIIAANSSEGKTALATTFTKTAMHQNHKVAFYSMEMMKHQLAARIIAMESGVSSSTMLYGKLSEYDMGKIESAIGRIPMDNLLIDDEATSNIETIMASIRNMHRKYGIKGAVIDYLQILNVNMKANMTKTQLMAEVARRLKNLAKDLGIWIIALSQLNRDGENPEPQTSRIRDSGEIAEAADTVIMIYRPELYGKNYPKPFENKSTHNTAMIKVTKGRNTGIFSFVCTFIPELTMYIDESVRRVQVSEEMPF